MINEYFIQIFFLKLKNKIIKCLINKTKRLQLF